MKRLLKCILLFLLIALTITACRGDDPSKFNLSLSLCMLAEGNPNALPYDPTGGINKVVIFYENAEGGGRTIAPEQFPIEGWIARNVFGQNRKTEGSLVACLNGEPADEIKVCTYEVNNKQVIGTLYDAVYDVTLYEGTTGEVLDTGSINGPAGECPPFAGFPPRQDRGKIYGKPDLGELVDFLRPYVAP